MEWSETPREWNRRQWLAATSMLGVGTVGFQRSLAQAAAEKGEVTLEMIRDAEWIAGLELSDEEREATLKNLRRNLDQLRELRQTPIDHGVAPALQFDPQPFVKSSSEPIARTAVARETSAGALPATDEEIAFLPVTELAALLRTRKLTSQRLTRIYLDRLQKYDPLLNCVVTLTEATAMQQAERADAEMDRGQYRGSLHGIPWGAKDLMAYPGYPTTWGATETKQQQFDFKATVAERLDQAGAVLVAKLSLGALAMGDKWFGKRTNNPWDPERGSSGSSAGSASAVAAGLVGFAIGTETLGSIVSPCRRCGCAGLRPTFGRVSRYGCMTLSWSMDKVGPIARGLEDCALILDAIHGADQLDATVKSLPFTWPCPANVRTLRVGYFEDDPDSVAAADVLKRIGVQLVSVQLPDALPVWAVATMLDVEAATVFDDWTRKKITQDLNEWPDIFRAAEFVSAVDYLRAARIRSQLMVQMSELFDHIDCLVGNQGLPHTNLTGHPAVVVPHGYEVRNGRTVPTSITFTGNLYQEDILLQLADRYQREMNLSIRYPELDRFLAEQKTQQEDSATPAAEGSVQEAD